jgi:hypothetical protein
MAALDRGGYCRDFLYQDTSAARQYVLLRYWKSEESRRAALEDPELLRCWSKLSHEVQTAKVYETLEPVV